MSSSLPYEQEYIDYLDIELGLSDRTIYTYRFQIGQFMKFAAEGLGDGLKVVDIEEKHLRSFLAYLKNERGNSPVTRNRHLTSLRSYFRFLVLYGYVDEGKNPVRRLRNVKIKRKLPVFLHEDEANLLLEHARMSSVFPERDYAMIKLLLQTGCRRSELVGLELDQIDLAERYVRFWGKGNKERIVPLTESTCKAIEAYLAVRNPWERECRRVFISHWGLPLDGGGAGTVLARICKSAGLENRGITLHKLRHTCFTLLLKAGVDLVTIKEIAGHEDISTTSIYTHVTQNEVRAAMEKHPFK